MIERRVRQRFTGEKVRFELPGAQIHKGLDDH